MPAVPLLQKPSAVVAAAPGQPRQHHCAAAVAAAAWPWPHKGRATAGPQAAQRKRSHFQPRTTDCAESD